MSSAIHGRGTHPVAATVLPDTPHRRTIAVCFYGMLARLYKGRLCWLNGCKGDGSNANVWLTEHVAYASFLSNVVTANPSFDFDVFLHTWDTVHEAHLQRLYRPRIAAFGALPVNISKPVVSHGWPATSTPPMFASIEHVLSLKRRAEVEQGHQYDWAMVTRFDVVWLFPLPLAHMNSKLLYLANWCQAKEARVPVAQADDESCHALGVYERMLPPDYYLAANSSHMDSFFGNLTSELESFKFLATREGTGNHKVIAGRIRYS